MDTEQARRFLHTARRDDTRAVEHDMHWVDDATGADDAVHLARLRLLAAATWPVCGCRGRRPVAVPRMLGGRSSR